MTGAVLELKPEEQEKKDQIRLLNQKEMETLFNRYNDILNEGLQKGYTTAYDYEEGDMLFIDNLSVGHRAAPEAHEPIMKQGLRILHRTTVAGMMQFTPTGLPPILNIDGPNPLGPGSDGVWLGGK
jgi:taurine dioxygenase